MTRRRLRPEEIELWRKVTDTTHRLHPERAVAELPKPKPKPHKAPHARMAMFEVGQSFNPHPPKHDIRPSISDSLLQAPVSMNHKQHRNMKRGKMQPESKIDLHGMTLDQAHPALTSFILRAHRSGKRLVLVITGKGRIAEPYGRRGVLKNQVPQWLMLAPISSAVMQISEAHIKHGGTGAYYVYLRRPR